MASSTSRSHADGDSDVVSSLLELGTVESFVSTDVSSLPMYSVVSCDVLPHTESEDSSLISSPTLLLSLYDPSSTSSQLSLFVQPQHCFQHFECLLMFHYSSMLMLSGSLTSVTLSLENDPSMSTCSYSISLTLMSSVEPIQTFSSRMGDH